MGLKLLWSAITIIFVAQAFTFPAAGIVAAIFAIIGIIMYWLDK